MSLDHHSITSSFNQDFCNHLAYCLTGAFENYRPDKFTRLWCDGIKMPYYDSQLSIVSITRTRKVITQGWFGENGQEVYDITIKFGKCAMEKCMNGLSLIDCLPDEDSLNWVMLDIENKKIVLSLQ
jgi:hypothetical protein